MFKIGEFARISKVSIKMLRYYDEMGLLKPVFVDQETGYRYYSADQLVRLNQIIAFKACGFTLREIDALLQNTGDTERLIAELRLKKVEIEKTINVERERENHVQALLNGIVEKQPVGEYPVVLKAVEAIYVASVRGIVPDYNAQGPLWSVLGRHLAECKTKIGLPCFVLYHDSQVEDGVDVEVAEPLLASATPSDHVKVYTLPGAQMASTVHHGSFMTIRNAYTALTDWIDHGGYRLAGPHRELYLKGEWATDHPEEYVTEIQFPIVKR